MDLATIVSTVILIPLGLTLGWAMLGRELPEVIVPEEKTEKKVAKKKPKVTKVAETKQRLHKILAKAEINPAAKLTKPKLKTALNKLIKSDILFLAINQYGFTLNKNFTKPLMIDSFINQLSAQQKKAKKNA